MATCQPSRNSRLFPLRPLYALPDSIPFTAVLSAGGFRTRHTNRPILNLSYNHRNETKTFRIIQSGSIFLGLIMHRYDTLQCLAPLRILAERRRWCIYSLSRIEPDRPYPAMSSFRAGFPGCGLPELLWRTRLSAFLVKGVYVYRLVLDSGNAIQ
jgi:hypothetical protein